MEGVAEPVEKYRRFITNVSSIELKAAAWVRFVKRIETREWIGFSMRGGCTNGLAPSLDIIGAGRCPVIPESVL
jgi:hypothetical protein